MIALGIGLGLTLQVLVLVAQNAVDQRGLGVATSTATFFRAIGGSVGAALFGAVLAIRLEYWLSRLGEPGTSAGAGSLDGSAVEAWANALQDVFLTAIPFALLACLVVALARELPLDDGSLRRSRLA